MVPHLKTLLYKAGIFRDIEPSHCLVSIVLLPGQLKPAQATFTFLGMHCGRFLESFGVSWAPRGI